MLKLYVNKKLIDETIPYVPLLYPFWGTVFNKNTPFPNAAFEKYGFNLSHYQITESITEADYVLLPHNYWHLKDKHDALLQKFIDEAQKNNKLILIDARSDIEGEVAVPHSVVLKIAQFRFQLRPNEVIVPCYVDDLLESFKGGIFVERKKENSVPVIGFSGWAQLSWKQYLKTLIKEFPVFFWSFTNHRAYAMKKGVLWRKEAIKALLRSSRIRANIIARSSYSGHLQTIAGGAETFRREFIENILSSDYALDVRGDANASCRFYEILSLGRIPLYLDTERVLPLENIINYDEVMVSVPFDDIRNIGDIAADFHRHISPAEFIAMQKRAREVFEQYLRIDRFTPHLMNELRARAAAYYGKSHEA